MSGAEQIAEERQRQIDEEGWTPEHDRTHVNDALAMAAVRYALPDEWRRLGVLSETLWPVGWTFKPTPGDRVRELVKAGALIAAEIDRLTAPEGTP